MKLTGLDCALSTMENHARLIACLLWGFALQCLLLASCASALKPTSDTVAAELNPPIELPLRFTQGEYGGEFLPTRAGAEFAESLPFSRCAVAANAAEFTPNGDSGSIDDLAYCTYALELPSPPDAVVLNLTFSAAPPAGECFIGLSDWDLGAWDWQQLPAGDSLELEEASSYANAENGCLVVVAMLGSNVSVLDSIGFASSYPAYTLLKTMDISPTLAPDGAAVGRPDVVEIEGTLYLAYGIRTERNFRLAKLNADLDLSLADGPPTELFSGYHDFSVDIRVSQANNNLWYAFEDNKFGEVVGDTHFLNSAWYSATDNLIGEQTDIATGILTTIPDAFEVDPADVPPDPEAVDDPTPLWHNGSYYVFTRAWSGWIEEFTPNSKHHVRVFNGSFEQTDDFMVDFSTIIPGKTISQNTLINIDGQVLLIGGFYDARDDIPSGSAIHAIPLSPDLKSTVGEKIPLLDEPGEWRSKVTAARVYDGKLFINYGEFLAGYSIQNIAVFDIDNDYSLITSMEISRFVLGGEAPTANHTTFEILNGRLYVFYPEIDGRIFAKIFSL